MSTLAIVLLVLVALFALFFVGGYLGLRRRLRAHAGAYTRHLAEADQALERARATDRGWDRAVMEDVVRTALEREHPGRRFEQLELVLVDDRPGVDEDRARFEASDAAGSVQVVLGRSEGRWVAETVG